MRYWDNITERLPKEPIRWPGNARIAVLTLFDYQAEVGEWAFPDGTPNYGQITEASYGGRVAIWRLLDILDRQEIKATINVCGITAERYPRVCSRNRRARPRDRGAYLHASPSIPVVFR
jgi:peptidoglycan/xylan/chitin deacetylase (PgdA/CDA1 family)